jgi:hypothetical protein
MAEIPDWQLERFRVGELPRAEQDAIAGAVERDAALRLRVEALAASDREILAAHPPRLAAAVIRSRAASAPRARGRGRLVLAVAASLAVLGAGIGLLPLRDDRTAARDETRIKGQQPHLAVFRQTQAGVEALADGSRAREGDLVQLAYQAAGRRFGVIVSIDGRGVVTVHHPRDGREAARLVPGRAVRLPSAYRLDDAPGRERFVLVTGGDPFDVAVVVDAAERLAAGSAGPALTLPPPLEQSWFTLSKEDRR